MFNQHKAKPTYYYVVGTSDTTGRRVIYARKNTEMEAQMVADKIHNAHCEIIPSHYSDSRQFARELRADVLEQTGDIDVSLQRFKHLENKEGSEIA